MLSVTGIWTENRSKAGKAEGRPGQARIYAVTYPEVRV